MPTDLLRPPPRALFSAACNSVSDLWRPVAAGAYRDLRRPRPHAAAAAVPRTTFDPRLPQNIANPYPELKRIREHPVMINERLGVWMIGRYDDMHTAVRDSETFSSRDGVMLRSFVSSIVLFADPPEHTRLRQHRRATVQQASDSDVTNGHPRTGRESVAALNNGDVVDVVRQA